MYKESLSMYYILEENIEENMNIDKSKEIYNMLIINWGSSNDIKHICRMA